MIAGKRLDELCDVVMGQAPPSDAYNLDQNGWPLIAGASDFGETSPEPTKYTTQASKISCSGDIILGIRATIGEKVISDGEYCLGRGVAALRPREDVNSRFLWHWLTQATPKLESKAKGATFKQVNRSDIGALEVPFPPLPEQRRIAEVLDKTDALRTKRRTALAQLDELAQSIFLDMFGDPVVNPKEWDDNFRLADVAEIASGITKGRKSNLHPTREIPYLAVINVQDRKLDLSTIKMIEATEEEISRYRLCPNDLLLTEGGDPDKLGRGTLWNTEIPECIHQNHVFRVRLVSDRLTPVFLNWLIGSERGKRYFLRSAKQTTGIASINMTQLKGFPLLIPPYSLQTEFVHNVEAIEALKSQHHTALGQFNELFSSLQQRAFRGEL